MKRNRLETIRVLLLERQISSQEELLGCLREKGITTTQATLSRDMRELGVSKRPNSNGLYVYDIDVKPRPVTFMMTQALVSVSCSGNLMVIRTQPGYASYIAATIDHHALASILGTIAGDDTVLVVLSEGAVRDEVEASIRQLINH